MVGIFGIWSRLIRKPRGTNYMLRISNNPIEEHNGEKAIPYINRPAILQALHWVLDPVGYMHSCKEHGNLFAANITGPGTDPIVFVWKPSLLAAIFNKDRQEFMAPGDGIAVLEPLVGRTSVVNLEGSDHQHRRRLLAPAFRGERLQSYARKVSQIARQETIQLQNNHTFLAHQLTQRISLEVIMQAMFGMQGGRRYEQTKQILLKIFDMFGSPRSAAYLHIGFLQGKWGFWRTFLRRREHLDALLYAEITERQMNPSRAGDDVLSLLINSSDAEGRQLTALECRNELLTLLLAGLETTSTVMAWAMYWIHRLPDVKQAVLREIDSLSEAEEAVEQVRLPYLTAICQETMRMHPPVPFTFARIAQQDLVLEGYWIPKGTRLVGCMELLHHRRDLFPEDNVFRPERFIEHRFNAYEFMPFGAGSRRCIGEHLAMLELRLALSTLLRQFEFELATSKPEKPRRRGVILSPARGVPMHLKGMRTPSDRNTQARGDW